MMGERLGKWTLSTEIGRGGMGRVYLAVEDLTGRQAAVKILAAELATDPGFLGRFEREIEALSKLSHPHIVQFYDSGSDAGRFYYAMEYVQGESLDEIVQHKKRIAWRDFLEIALQICPALKHVHDHGIIHRDIKLSNILIREDGILKLTDFGIAKVFATNDLTQTGGVVGTAEYLSPEQAAGKPVTKKSDIYSLGVVFYGLLTGRLPFDGASFLDLMHKHRYAQFDPPAKIAFDIPHDIDEVVCQMLEKDPAKRPPDCMVLAKQLDSIRKKLQRKDEGTRAPDTETVAQTRAVFNPKKAGPITLAERFGTANDVRGPIGRFFNNPLVVGALLALCVGTILYPFLRRPSDNEMLLKGMELMHSERLADKEAAWSEYFEPLLRRPHGDAFKTEIEKQRRRLEAARRPELSEAKQFLDLADKRIDAGDLAGAQAVWRNIIVAFDGVAAEEYAVDLAKQRLAVERPLQVKTEKLSRVRPILDRAAALRANGKRDEAERVLSALETLYQNDPAGGAVLDAIDAARK